MEQQIVQISYDELLAAMQVNNDMVKILVYCIVFMLLIQIMRFILK